jgi:hypothetical protein
LVSDGGVDRICVRALAEFTGCVGNVPTTPVEPHVIVPVDDANDAVVACDEVVVVIVAMDYKVGKVERRKSSED